MRSGEISAIIANSITVVQLFYELYLVCCGCFVRSRLNSQPKSLLLQTKMIQSLSLFSIGGSPIKKNEFNWVIFNLVHWKQTTSSDNFGKPSQRNETYQWSKNINVVVDQHLLLNWKWNALLFFDQTGNSSNDPRTRYCYWLRRMFLYSSSP